MEETSPNILQFLLISLVRKSTSIISNVQKNIMFLARELHNATLDGLEVTTGTHATDEKAVPQKTGSTPNIRYFCICQK